MADNYQAGQWIFSSESVTEGHPDKVCDQISDAILDAILEKDPEARVACETITNTGMVLVMGEITTNTYVDITSIARDTIDQIGYNRPEYGFDANTCAVLTALKEQSPDISMGVTESLEARNGETDPDLQTGAGDQGMMFGYACTETPELMPLPIALAHRLTKRLAEVRKDGTLPHLRPDGKAQVTVQYDGNDPIAVTAVVISTQHDPTYGKEELHADIKREVIGKIIPTELLSDQTKILINPTGRFVVGGPNADSGLTGRKIIVDTYGGMAAHGGGSFSGKDPTKVDRTATYYTRYAAKNLVAAGLCKRVQIQVAYSIGVARPLSIEVDTYGTGVLEDERLAEIVEKHFNFTPNGMIRELELRRPIYRQLASYGHVGRPDLDLSWERLDKVEELKQYLP